MFISSCRLDAEDVGGYRHAGFVYDAPARWVAPGDLRFLRTMNNMILVVVANEVRRRVRTQVDREAEEPIWIQLGEQEEVTPCTRIMRGILPCCEYHYAIGADMDFEYADLPLPSAREGDDVVWSVEQSQMSTHGYSTVA